MENSDDIYGLITKLCERFTHNEDLVRKLRSITYEILLKKRHFQYLQNSEINKYDPYACLLAWQFNIAYNLGYAKHGKELKTSIDLVQQKCQDGDSITCILRFLLCLKQVPKIEEDDNQLENLNGVPETDLISNTISTNKMCDNEEIWNVAASNWQMGKHRNWEFYGTPEPDKERPFLTELQHVGHLILGNLLSTYSNGTTSIIQPKIITIQEFIKDLKYLMVGLASRSFIYNANGDFELVKNITVDGVCPKILQEFSVEMIQCGGRFKVLNENCTVDPITGRFRNRGHIFTELCSSVKRYLNFYRAAIFHVSDENHMGLIKFAQMTAPLRRQIFALSKISQLDRPVVPHSVVLLNDLYHELLKCVEKNTILVLYSILYSCCQVYFRRFLQQWIMHGTIDDPYDEFFVRIKPKYAVGRTRNSWMRTFSIRDDLVPVFLRANNLPHEILQCGRTMNLLRHNCPMNTLCCRRTDDVWRQPLTLVTCVSSDQLHLVEQNCTSYYLDMIGLLGPEFSASTLLDQHTENRQFIDLVAAKRALTLRRIELERRKQADEEKSKKLDDIVTLKDQYDLALQQKHTRIAIEIEHEIRSSETDLQNERLREQLIRDEATKMIGYYEELSELSENRRKLIEKHTDLLKTINLEHTPMVTGPNDSTPVIPPARSSPPPPPAVPPPLPRPLTEAQRNKLKVMSTEFGISLPPSSGGPVGRLNQMQMNRQRNLQSSQLNFYALDADTDDDVNVNVIPKTSINTSHTLTLPLAVPSTPISQENTPLSELLGELPTPVSKSTTTIRTFDDSTVGDNYDSSLVLLSLGGDIDAGQKSVIVNNTSNVKRLERHLLPHLHTSSRLKLFLQESVKIPLQTQCRLVNSEILRYFFVDLHYLRHLDQLRGYFFLQNGEFSRSITDHLYDQLYRNPHALFNCCTLQKMVLCATMTDDTSNTSPLLISFKVNGGTSPVQFDVGDVDVLQHCLSLTYKVTWPLNILLTEEVVGRYDTIFKYLMKLNRMAWVLRKCATELKQVAHHSGRKEIYLMVAPQYRCVHQWRHLMLHFVQTLQNHIVGNVLQPAWLVLKENLQNATSLNDVYQAHHIYMKNILFLCLLNEKSSPLRKLIYKIFTVILKFYEYFRAGQWTVTADGTFTHTNFTKLNCIFRNFHEIVLYLYRLAKKASQSGYQPHLTQLLNTLDINDYYGKCAENRQKKIRTEKNVP